MKLEVERLTAEPTPFAYEEGSAWWCARMPRDPSVPREVVQPFTVTGIAYRGGGSEDILLEGAITGAFELECARCLARYRHSLSEPFRFILEPAGLRTPAEPEAAEALVRDGMCLADEVELGWYRGSEIQLDSVCLELIALALPVKPLCREDCAGLCARCGADRNVAPCGCSEAASKSPFAVLAALRGERGAE
jgi:DUF177 domain-containing protein